MVIRLHKNARTTPGVTARAKAFVEALEETLQRFQAIEVVIVRSHLQKACLLQLYVSERFLPAGKTLRPKSSLQKTCL